MFFSSAERPVAFDFHDVRDELIYHEADFRVGGRDVFRCGPKVDLKFRGETSYFLIVPNVCVVSSEALDMNGQHVAASLTALDFERVGHATELTVTVHARNMLGPRKPYT